jgi:hypothetical protein
MAVERNGSQTNLAVERVGATSSATSERVGAQVSSAVERNGSSGLIATERVGGTLLSSLERIAGEGRLTTTVTDAASRQAASDIGRDISVSVERNGAAGVQASQTAYAGLLGSIERNSGETRANMLHSQAQTQSLVTDVRHSILNDVTRGTSDVIINGNRGVNELLNQQFQGQNILSKHITDGAWENRTAVASAVLEQLKMGESIKASSAAQYSSILLENAKNGALLSSQSANEYSSMLLEQQKMKEYLASKGDNQFAMTQLELQKVKEGLACQAAQNFSISQLEQQKLGSLLSAQMADAKYEALKSQQYVADKVDDCCCSVKEKIDMIDRDRLRDGLTVEKNDNNILKIIELTQLARGGWDRGDDRRPHRR